MGDSVVRRMFALSVATTLGIARLIAMLLGDGAPTVR